MTRAEEETAAAPTAAWTEHGMTAALDVWERLKPRVERMEGARRRRQLTPEQIADHMAQSMSAGVTAPGTFTEYDLAPNEPETLVRVNRANPAERAANLVVGELVESRPNK